jgi:hypothetical protein
MVYPDMIFLLITRLISKTFCKIYYHNYIDYWRGLKTSPIKPSPRRGLLSKGGEASLNSLSPSWRKEGDQGDGLLDIGDLASNNAE